LAEKFSIPAEDMVVLKRNTMTTASTLETLSQQFNMERKLAFVRVLDGTILYIEQKNPEEIKTNWVKEFEREASRYTIKFNTPGDAPNQYGQVNFKNAVVIDKREPFSKLKAAIAAQLEKPIDTFIVKRGGQYGSEIKDENATIFQCSLMNYSTLYVEEGVPSKVGEYRLQISVASSGPEEAKDLEDNYCYKYSETFDVAASDRLLTSEFKDLCVEKARLKFPDLQIDPEKVRIRER
jgi:hypothetical protein